MFGQRSGGRPIVATIAVAMLGLFGSGSDADAATKTVRTPEGDSCATADSAPQSSLPAVLEACNTVVTQAEGTNLGRFQRYRGRALERTGQLAAAVSAYTAALQILPNDEWSLKWRAPLRATLGDTQGAIADYRQLNAMQPNISDWRRAIAKLGGTPPEREVADATPPPPPPEPPKLEAKEEPQQPPKEAAKDNKTEESFDTWLTDYAKSPEAAPPKSPEDEKAEQERLAKEAELAALVKRAQTELTRLGYDIGPVDGVIGPRSRNALNDWSRKNGRPAVREPDETVVVALEQAPTPAPAQPPQQVQVAQGDTKSVEQGQPAGATPPAPLSPVVETKPPATQGMGGMRPNTGPEQPIPPMARLEPEVPKQPPAAAATLPSADGGKRVALVIGNSDYQNVTRLRNPRQDAEDMAAALHEIGFEVTAGYDLDRREMEEITKKFARLAARADVALTYYSGHALQSDGTNLLVPVDGQLRDEYDFRDLLGLDQLVRDTGRARDLAVVIVDACRDNPLSGRQNGLAQPGPQPANSLIAYAAAPGSVAYDGKGRNSPYVTALLRHLRTPGMDVRRMFGFVKEDVVRDTKAQQQPVDVNTLGGGDYLLVATTPETNGVELTQLTRGEVRAIELSLNWLGFWSGDADGVVTPPLLAAMRRSGAEVSGDKVTSAEIVALHRRAAPARGRMALPPVGNTDDLQLQALDGDRQAYRLLGQIYDPAYEFGGLQKSRPLARANYKRAADAGDVEAAARLGLMLASPASQPADQQEAQHWLETAAKAGDAEASLRLAELLLAKDGDPQARAQAIELLKIAAAKPDTEGFANARLRDLGYQVETASSL